MTELLTAAQMRAIEQAAIESGEVTGLELMERAGRGVVEAIMEWRPELATAPHRAVVLCGPGNNGGDGFVVARLLKQRGWEVEVFLYGEETKLPPDAAENAQRWREMGEINSPIKSKAELVEADIILDALFGIGLNRPLDGSVLDVTEMHFDAYLDDGGVDGYWEKLVAVDVPSGTCADSGSALSASFVHAALTVTFQNPKIGHYLSPGTVYSDRLAIVDIGLGKSIGWQNEVVLVDQHSLSLTVPFDLPKEAYTHKYDHGHALVLSGGPGKGGAARLAARGALRIGAGLVTVGCPSEAIPENAARLDAIMLAEIESADALSTELEARKVKAVCIGPGFGLGARLRGFVSALLGRKDGLDTHPTIVLDADALTEFQDDPETLFGMLHEDCVLTPHQGEFGRLFPDILEKLKEPATRGPAYSKVDATREAAKRAGCVVLFKGADTVIAEPSGRCAINSAHYERAAPWLATAGSGDVLSGFITGLLARGFAPMQAAETAAWLHVECALKFGPGLIAEDLPEQLPAVFRDLGL